MKNIKYKFIATLFLLLTAIFISCDEDDESTLADSINPYIVSFNPVSGVNGVDLSADLVLTFDDAIAKGQGNINLIADIPEANQVIDIASDQVVVGSAGRTLTINPQDFLPGRVYTITVDEGFVTDLAGNAFYRIPDDETWTFTSGGNAGDTDAPQLVSTMPEDGSTDGATTSISLVFDEDVKVGTGNIVVYNSSDAVVATIDAEGELVTVDGVSVLITLPASLNFGESYYVQIASGVIKDIAGNGFPGMTDTSTWNFTTTAGSGSDLVVHLPFDENMNDDSGNKLNAMQGASSLGNVEFVTDATRGQVIQFPAATFAQFPQHDLLRPSNDQDFSINFWIKLAGTDSDPAIVSNKNWGSGGNPGFVLCTDDGHLYQPGNGEDHGWIMNVSGNPKQDGNRMDWRAADCDTPGQAPSMSDDQWHMITAVFDQASGTLLMYIDGVNHSNAANADRYDIGRLTGSLYDEVNDYPLTIWEDGTGAYNAGDDRRAAMTGLMDEFSYYNKALTPAEITALLAL